MNPTAELLIPQIEARTLYTCINRTNFIDICLGADQGIAKVRITCEPNQVTIWNYTSAEQPMETAISDAADSIVASLNKERHISIYQQTVHLADPDFLNKVLKAAGLQ